MCHMMQVAPGSRLICTLSDIRLRDLLKRFGHSTHLAEDYVGGGQGVRV